MSQEVTYGKNNSPLFMYLFASILISSTPIHKYCSNQAQLFSILLQLKSCSCRLKYPTYSFCKYFLSPPIAILFSFLCRYFQPTLSFFFSGHSYKLLTEHIFSQLLKIKLCSLIFCMHKSFHLKQILYHLVINIFAFSRIARHLVGV